MTELVWSVDKNRQLQDDLERAISFEDIASAIENGGLLDDVEHSNGVKYPNQRIYVVLFRNYVYCVPYVRDGDVIFLKTIFPSRKFTRKYLSGEKND